MIGTTSGMVVLLCFILLCVHVTLRLHATTVVTSAAADGARVVASARVDQHDPMALTQARGAAETQIRGQLGQVGETASFEWTGSTPDEVVLRVRVDVPDVLPPDLSMALPFDTVDRTIRLRTEQAR